MSRNKPALNFIRVAKDGWSFEETRTGRPFTPFGCNYYNPHTGWPPQMWTRFDRAAITDHFRLMEDLGMNAIRVWVQWASFMPERGKLAQNALDRCRELLSLARASGIRVNLTGPDFWEGVPPWLQDGNITGSALFVDPSYLEAHAEFWGLLGAELRNEEDVYAFDLVNEPFMPWDVERIRTLWNLWLKERYGSLGALRGSWGSATTSAIRWGEIPPPPNRRVPGSRFLLDYQTFREEMAFRWIASSVAALRANDPNHPVTVGLHQSSCPFEEIIPSRYTAFNPHRLRVVLDYTALHWYPFGNPLTAATQPFDLPENTDRSLSMFLTACRYCHAGMPLVLEEFSYYGGGSPAFWGGVLPHRSEQEQNTFLRMLISTGAGSVVGWLHWPLMDTPGSTDTSSLGGLFAASARPKLWSRAFASMAARYTGRRPRRKKGEKTIGVSRTALLTDWSACAGIVRRCYRYTQQGQMWDFSISDGGEAGP